MASTKMHRGHLDVQFSPSKWSTRMCSCEVMKDHMNYIKTESENARQNIPCQIDVAYGKTSAEKLDIFGTDLPDDAAICFFVHGGFWQALGKDDSAFPALTLHAIGIKTFVVDYALCPHVTLNTIVEQVRRAFDFTRLYAEEHNTKSIYVMGHSAGAHLVAYLLGSPPSTLRRVEHAILISGLYDLRPVINCYANDVLHLTEEDAIELSPLLWWGAHNGGANLPEVENLERCANLKIAVVIAENDSPAFHAQSEQFYDALKRSQVQVEYIDIQGADHFDIAHSIVDADLPLGGVKDVILKHWKN